LYNIYSTWHDDDATKEQIKKLRLAVEKASSNLPPYASRSKRPTDTGGDHESKKTKTANSSAAGGGAADDAASDATAADGAARQLEDSGYEVVPDIFETDGDTWELINKVHIEIFSLTSH
jgi:hypothetical protein